VRNYRNAQGNQPYLGLVAEQIAFVDPARHTAKQLYTQLLKAKLARPRPASISSQHQFYITVPAGGSAADRLNADGGFTSEYKLGRRAGAFDTEDYRVVPMTGARLLPSAREIMTTRLPHVDAAWTKFDAQ
jgi:hypothetical protein